MDIFEGFDMVIIPNIVYNNEHVWILQYMSLNTVNRTLWDLGQVRVLTMFDLCTCAVIPFHLNAF